VILCGVCVSRQDERAGLSLCHRTLLVEENVLHQAACCLLDVCIILKVEKKQTCEDAYFTAMDGSVSLCLISTQIQNGLLFIDENVSEFPYRLCSSTGLSCNSNIKLKGNSGIFKPRPYFWHEIRSSTHREQFGESWCPSRAI